MLALWYVNASISLNFIYIFTISKFNVMHPSQQTNIGYTVAQHCSDTALIRNTTTNKIQILVKRWFYI